MVPTYIILKIIYYLPIAQQLPLFRSSRGLYDKSSDCRTLYRRWWKKYKNNGYKFDDLQFVHYLIQRGFNDWNYGLGGACKGGNIECVKLMIDRGADNWNYGLHFACWNGHMDCIKLMIAQGATLCMWCYESMESHLKN